MTCRSAILIILVCTKIICTAQKPHISFKDSSDKAFDVSDWLIDLNGFLPIASIITEPALGGFGGIGGLVFIDKNEPMYYNGKKIPQAPNITAGIGGYTLNGTWLVGGARMGSFPKVRLKYTVFGGLANVNMDYYFDVGDQEIKLGINARTVPISFSTVRQMRNPKWSAGIQYLFLSSELSHAVNIDLPDIGIPESFKSVLSIPGIVGEYDSRDNIFTPDKGLKVHTDVQFSDEFFGSDANYEHIDFFSYYYLPLGNSWKNGKNWICGLRLDAQQVYGTVPFYIMPYISMRGIPVMRYQGNSTLLIETEQRWDFVYRWSAVFFAGTGKAFDSYDDFTDAELVYSYGTGFRYLLARKFKMRMGIDVARGPEDWAYYIVFGSSWLK